MLPEIEGLVLAEFDTLVANLYGTETYMYMCGDSWLIIKDL